MPMRLSVLRPMTESEKQSAEHIAELQWLLHLHNHQPQHIQLHGMGA